MTGMAWVVFLVFLVVIFNKLLSDRVNPNQNLVTTNLGYAREVVLQRNPQGHYVATGSINQRPVTFLLDTGATDIAVPEGLAAELGLRRGPAVKVRTANGNAIAYRTRLDSVGLGDMQRQGVRATILSSMAGDQVLLGMSYLKHYELIQRGNNLTVRESGPL